MNATDDSSTRLLRREKYRASGCRVRKITQPYRDLNDAKPGFLKTATAPPALIRGRTVQPQILIAISLNRKRSHARATPHRVM